MEPFFVILKFFEKIELDSEENWSFLERINEEMSHEARVGLKS
jgi:hypothetical protein